MEDASQTPIVIDLGKVRRKSVKSLKKGRGKLLDEVQEVMAEVHANLGQETNGKVLVPVVMLYRRKPRKRRGAFPRLF